MKKLLSYVMIVWKVVKRFDLEELKEIYNDVKELMAQAKMAKKDGITLDEATVLLGEIG